MLIWWGHIQTTWRQDTPMQGFSHRSQSLWQIVLVLAVCVCVCVRSIPLDRFALVCLVHELIVDCVKGATHHPCFSVCVVGSKEGSKFSSLFWLFRLASLDSKHGQHFAPGVVDAVCHTINIWWVPQHLHFCLQRHVSNLRLYHIVEMSWSQKSSQR